MKLFYRVLIHLLIGIVLVLSAWAFVFYWGMMEEVTDEVDDSLEGYSELIMIRSLAGKELPAHDSGSNNQYFLKEVDAVYAHSKESICYRDSMIYIAEKGEMEPARILTTIFKDRNEKYYELSVYTPSIEKKDLREAIFQLLIGLFVALLVTILLINVWVFHQSMKPFYQLLDWLEKFRLGKKNEPLRIQTDTTEFKKLTDVVTRYATHSEEMFEQQKVFIGNASHEIQTPLAICMNRLEMLMEEEGLNEQQLAEIVKTYQTLEYVSKLNKSLLLLSKIDNSQFTDVKEINFNELVRRYVDDYQEVYDYRDIGMNIKEKGVFKLQMNETLAVILITNLLKNSFAHNIDKGRVCIEVHPASVRIGNTGENTALDESHIFERFYQGNQKKEGSTGLGLAIVDAICRQYQIRIRYRFTENMHWFELYR